MESSSSNQQLKQSINLIWLALLVSQFVIMYVGYTQVFPMRLSNEVGDSPNYIINIFLGIYALIAIGASLFYYGKARLKVKESLQKSLSFFVISFAMAESITIMGLVFGMVSSGELVNYAYSFFAIGLVIHLKNKPILS